MGMNKKSYKSDDDILESFSENDSIRIIDENNEYDSESECDSDETFSEWISRREEKIY